MNKRLVIIFSIIVVVVLFVVLNSAVFVVRSINVRYPENEYYSHEDVLTASSSIHKMNIFSLSENKIIAQLEKAVPYAQIIDVERSFPSKVLIKTELREPILAIRVNNSSDMIVLDKYLKILDVVSSSQSHPYTEIRGVTFNNTNYAELIGNFIIIKNDNVYYEIHNTVSTIQGLNSTLKGEAFCEFIKYIDFTEEDKVIITIEGNKYFSVSRTSLERDLQIALSNM